MLGDVYTNLFTAVTWPWYCYVTVPSFFKPMSHHHSFRFLFFSSPLRNIVIEEHFTYIHSEVLFNWWMEETFALGSCFTDRWRNFHSHRALPTGWEITLGRALSSPQVWTLACISHTLPMVGSQKKITDPHGWISLFLVSNKAGMFVCLLSLCV